MIKRVRAAMAALVLASAAAGAAPPADVVTSFEPALVVSILEATGAKAELRAEAGHSPFILARAANGLGFYAAFAACETGEAGCLGLDLVAEFRLPASAASLARVNEFSALYPFIKAYRIDEETMALSRYVTADAGIALGNIASNVQNFVGFADVFRSFLNQPMAAREEAARLLPAALHAEPRALAPVLDRNGDLADAPVNRITP